jgi:predicted transposase YdaD
MSMLTAEWNWDTAKRVWQDEAREEGLSQGREEGIGVGLAQGRDEILKLFEQGLSVEEIKKRLKN